MGRLHLILIPCSIMFMMCSAPITRKATSNIDHSSSISDDARPMSQELKRSGDAQVGQMIPFFSGWSIGKGTGRAYSLTKALKERRTRYVINICASWCKPCMAGLAQLSAARERFERTNTGLIILAADQSEKAREIYSRFGFHWANVIADEFKSFALKLAPEENQPNVEGGLSLPRTIVFDKEGKVLKIIGIEGPDYIDAIFSK